MLIYKTLRTILSNIILRLHMLKKVFFFIFVVAFGFACLY